MKLLVLIMCLGYAMANDKLLEELESILAKKDSSADPADVDTEADKIMQSLIKSLKEDDENDERMTSADKRMKSPLYDILMGSEDESLFDDTRSLGKKRGFFGYCQDGETLASGPQQFGCARKLCYDKHTDDCDKIFAKELRMTDEHERDLSIKSKCAKQYMYMREHCPYTCGYCKSHKPGKKCEESLYAPYGCCVMGHVPALRPDKSDCLRCRDRFPHSCRQFKTNRYGIACASNSYRVRKFLEIGCPVTCDICKAGDL